MMISMRRSFVIKSLPLVLIVFTIFTVSLTENLEIADGFSASAVKIIYELNPGEDGSAIWPISNIFEEPIGLEFYAIGSGSEFLIFEKEATIQPKQRVEFVIEIAIPDDHPNNIEYHPELYALKRSEGLAEGESGMIVNSQVRVNPIIKIGPNPIYTAPVVEEVIEEPVIVEEPIIEEPIVEETVEEKQAWEEFDKINKPVVIDDPVPELQVDDTFEETFEEEAVTDYVPEPIADTPIITDTAIVEEKIDCDFIAIFLSWLGIGKC